MKWTRQKYGKIEGEYDSDGIIQIDYRFSGGKIPGSSDNYRADGRTAYLPYNKRGRIALAMLIEAFKRKLTFNVGTSLTTSEKNVIVWAGIHHKTSMKGGEHGYPDPKYFDNLWQELKDRGIEPKDVIPTPPD